MSFNTDSYFDIDESLRVSELAHPTANMYMLVTTPDNQIKGERAYLEKYGGGGFTGLIDVHGYFFAGHKPQGNGKLRYRSLTIVKRTDIATPSLLSALNLNQDGLTVTLSVFHNNQYTDSNQPRWAADMGHVSGGNYNSRLADPWFSIRLSDAKIRTMSTFTSKYIPIPLDIVSFDFLRCCVRILSLKTPKGANECELSVR